MKLTKSLKNKWIKALTSGDYKQGTGCLWDRKDNTYCCLGVLGKICEVKGLSGDLKYQFLSAKNDNLKGLNKIPDELQGTDDIADILANMNDDGRTFEEIADYIKNKL